MIQFFKRIIPNPGDNDLAQLYRLAAKKKINIYSTVNTKYFAFKQNKLSMSGKNIYLWVYKNILKRLGILLCRIAHCYDNRAPPGPGCWTVTCTTTVRFVVTGSLNYNLMYCRQSRQVGLILDNLTSFQTEFRPGIIVWDSSLKII